MNRERLLDTLFEYLTSFLHVKSGDAMRAVAHDLVTMDDEELRVLYKDLCLCLRPPYR